MDDFEGLVALVTGGASGIGAATARLLQARGAAVAVLDRGTDGAPEGVLAVRCDVTDAAGVEAAVAPGTADTPWVARLLDAADDPAAAARALGARQPLGRLVTAEEVAQAIAALASPSAASTTGTVLRVTAA